jgi:putative endonuclease
VRRHAVGRWPLIDPLLRRELGIRAEEAAARYFLDAGHAVIGRNVRVGRLEIDLVVREESVVAIVEVRLRGPGAWVKPLASVDPKKQLRVRRAGERLWQTRFKKDRTLERMRFDIVAVRFNDERTEIEHVKAAF